MAILFLYNNPIVNEPIGNNIMNICVNPNKVLSFDVDFSNRLDLIPEGHVTLDFQVDNLNDLLDYKYGYNCPERDKDDLIKGIKALKSGDLIWVLNKKSFKELIRQFRLRDKIEEDMEVYMAKVVRYAIRNFNKIIYKNG